MSAEQTMTDLLAKLDDFAGGLAPVEQDALAALLTNDGRDNDVTGFGAPWPGSHQLIGDLRVANLTAQICGIRSPGSTYLGGALGDEISTVINSEAGKGES